jgi:hypothetical protein
LYEQGKEAANQGKKHLERMEGGVDIGKLEGVLPAAVFFSICNKINVCWQLDVWFFQSQ